MANTASYNKLFACVDFTIPDNGSSNLRAKRGSSGTKLPSNLTTLISIQLLAELVSRRKNAGANGK